MNTKGLGFLCQDCTKCRHYASFPTSNGCIPRCELDNICLGLSPKGTMVTDHCPAYLPLFSEEPTPDTLCE